MLTLWLLWISSLTETVKANTGLGEKNPNNKNQSNKNTPSPKKPQENKKVTIKKHNHLTKQQTLKCISFHFHFSLEKCSSQPAANSSHYLHKDHNNFFLQLSPAHTQTHSLGWPFQSGHLSPSLLVKDPFISQLVVPFCQESFRAAWLADRSALLSDLLFSCVILGFSMKQWFAWIIITSLSTEATLWMGNYQGLLTVYR